MPRPSPALIVAIIALFIALGGTSYAVTQLPRNSVGTTQLKKDAVTGAKIKAGAVGLGDISAAARASLKGATGATGPAGPTASAYVFDSATSFDPTTHPALDNLPGQTVATVRISPTFAARLAITAQVNVIASIIFSSANRRYEVGCQVHVDGVAVGAPALTTQYIFGTPDTQSAGTLVASAAADVAAGEHTVTFLCNQVRDFNYVVLNRPSILVVATAR